MKSFKLYLIEADFKRFLKKNKHLSSDQVTLINKFFKADKEAVKKYEKKWGWQSKHPQQMRWNDFQDIMNKYKSGRKLNLKSIKIPGKKGTDYWPIRLKTKGFIANIPLNWKTAVYMNTCKYGTLNVNYCIGWPNDKSYWNNHVLTEGKVPVYIVDGEYKWVVMIKKDNNSYEVWDKWNSVDVAKKDKEPISGFYIKKELLGSRMGKLYDDIRNDIYALDTDRPPYSKQEYEDATEEYYQLAEDIKDDVLAIAEAESDYNYYRNEFKYKNIRHFSDELEHVESKLKYAKKEENPDQAEVDKLTTERDAYDLYLHDLDDMFDEKEFKDTQKEFEKNYPEFDFELQGEMFKYYQPSYQFLEITDYPNLLNVLENQNIQLANRNKITENIKQSLSELAWEISSEQSHFAIEDVYIILSDQNIHDPEYSEEYYN